MNYGSFFVKFLLISCILREVMIKFKMMMLFDLRYGEMKDSAEKMSEVA